MGKLFTLISTQLAVISQHDILLGVVTIKVCQRNKDNGTVASVVKSEDWVVLVLYQRGALALEDNRRVRIISIGIQGASNPLDAGRDGYLIGC